MKLSDLKPGDYQVESDEPSPQKGALKLSDLNDKDVQVESGPGLLSKAIDAGGRAFDNYVEPTLNKIASYTSAPTRSAISSLIEQPTSPIQALRSGWKQFGEDPKLAPTGEQILAQAGVPDKPLGGAPDETMMDTDPQGYMAQKGWSETSPRKLGGAVVDYVADPLVVASELKGLGKLAGAAKETAAADKAASIAGNFGAKLGETLTGVPKQDIKTYATRADEVKGLLKEAGGQMPVAEDLVREKAQAAIQNTRKELNNQISTALQEKYKMPSPDQLVDINPIVDSLETKKAKLNPNLKADDIADIDEIINKVKGETSTGKVTPAKLYEIQQYLRDQAKGSYAKSGQIFTRGDEAQRASKQAATMARQSLNSVAPEIKAANEKLAELHEIEDNINKNLIAPGKPGASLYAAGSGSNERSAKLLNDLKDITGYDLQRQAENLSAARSFENPDWLPVDKTGKSLARMAVGGGAGHGLLGPLGVPLGMMATNPATLKYSILAGRAAAKPLGLLNKGLLK